jgi:hypothetical protein
VLILSQNHNFSKGLSLSSPISYLPGVVKVKKQEHGNISMKNGNNNNNNEDSYLGTPSITFQPSPSFPTSTHVQVQTQVESGWTCLKKR